MMKRMTMWLSWINAFLGICIYTKLFDRPEWVSIVLTAIVTAGYICGLFIDGKDENDEGKH